MDGEPLLQPYVPRWNEELVPPTSMQEIDPVNIHLNETGFKNYVLYYGQFSTN